MQLGAVLVFDAGPLLLRHGGIDVERVRNYTALRIPSVSRARERRGAPGVPALALFVADPGFELEYHVRHACLPRPADERALKRLVGRIFSEPLDPARPLWELWVVEGLEDSRFALVVRCDESLVAPESQGDLVAALLARHAPTSAEPGGGLAARAGAELYRLAASAVRPSRVLARVAAGALAAADLAEAALARSDAPFEPARAGALRRVDWLALEASDVAAVRSRLGGSERDVALAALCGGLRRLFERRGVEAHALHALLPIRVAGHPAAPRIRLPLAAPDTRAAFVLLRAQTERGGAGLPEDGACPLRELAALARAAAAGRRAELAAAALTDVRREPSLLGAPLRALVPVLPPLPGHALGVTVARQGGHVFLGLAADASRVPDLSALADGIASAFDELRRIVGEVPARAAAARGARPRRRRGADKPPEAEAR